jgi:ABC-type multidrug transport system permease subunit
LVCESIAAKGWALVGTLFAMHGVVAYLNPLIEAIVFQVVPPREAIPLFGAGVAGAFVVSVILAATLGRLSRPSHWKLSGLQRGLPWRLPLVALSYSLLYFTAGMVVSPFVKDFYAGKTLPSLGHLFGLQLARGLIYTAGAALFLMQMAGRRPRAAWLLGLVYSVVGGIAPLMAPNPYLPAQVRLPHAFEMGTSNFLFGLVSAYLLVPGSAEGDGDGVGRASVDGQGEVQFSPTGERAR